MKFQKEKMLNKTGTCVPWYAKPSLWVFGLFLLSVVIRFFFADFEKMIHTYADEYLYFQIARSLATQGRIEIYNYAVDFQNILYSVLISPAFLLKEPEMQIKLVSLINCIMMSAGVFPVYLLGRRLLKSKTLILASCVLYLIASDMVYSMTFMSENAFLPLGVLTIYLFFCLFDWHGTARMRYLLCVALGGMCYLLYFCKQVGLTILLAYILGEIIWAIWESISQQNKLERISICKNAFQNVLLVCISFFIIYMTMKLTVFADVGNSYMGIGLFQRFTILLEPGKFRYLLYSFVYFICSVLIAYSFFPVLLPAVSLQRMDSKTKRISLFLLMALIASAGIISLTISCAEDFDRLQLRVHLRYVCYLFAPFLIVSLRQVENMKTRFFKSSLQAASGLIIFSLFLILFYRGVSKMGAIVDHTMLYYLLPLTEDMVCIATCGMAIILAIGLFFLQKKKRWFLIFSVTVLATSQLINSQRAILQFNQSYGSVNTLRNEVRAISSFAQAHADDTIVMLGDVLDDRQRMYDTYLQADNVYIASLSHYLEAQKAEGTLLSVYTFNNLLPYIEPTQFDAIDYLIVPVGNTLSASAGSYDRVDIPDVYSADVYQLNQTNKLPYIQKWWTFNEGSTIIPVNGRLFSSLNTIEKGRFVSGETAGYLLFGPYRDMAAGTYDITFRYHYKGTQVGDTVIGFVDLSSGNADLTGYHDEFTASIQEVTIHGIAIPDGCSSFETRMYTYVSGIELYEIVVTKYPDSTQNSQ